MFSAALDSVNIHSCWFAGLRGLGLAFYLAGGSWVALRPASRNVGDADTCVDVVFVCTLYRQASVAHTMPHMHSVCCVVLAVQYIMYCAQYCHMQLGCTFLWGQRVGIVCWHQKFVHNLGALEEPPSPGTLHPDWLTVRTPCVLAEQWLAWGCSTVVVCVQVHRRSAAGQRGGHAHRYLCRLWKKIGWLDNHSPQACGWHHAVLDN